MLNNIHKIMHVSFLFCTATQPAFETRHGFNGISSIISLVKNPAKVFNQTRRVTYYKVNNNKPVDIAELAKTVIAQNQSVLIVFNTKRSARGFFEFIKEKSIWDTVYHLSTSMCPHHRKSAIKSIRENLVAKSRILVASTQLIEAGVDFDFPCVFREMAPLESIIQAAGRCNREGEMKTGSVFIFRLANGGMPDKLYRSSAEYTLELIGEDIEQLYRHDFFTGYYRKIMNLFIDVDKRKINESRRNFNFETVAQSYRIIDKATEVLFIRDYNEESAGMYSLILNQGYISRDDYRRLQEYSVQVYQHFLVNNQELWIEDIPGFKIWYGGYDYETGLSIEMLSPDQFIV
jgi:CRISPR-associated endonuclease/helicase Cas3